MKITIETTPKISECHRGKELQLTDDFKEMIKDQLFVKLNQIYECATVNGMLADVLITFDDTDITNIEF